MVCSKDVMGWFLEKKGIKFFFLDKIIWGIFVRINRIRENKVIKIIIVLVILEWLILFNIIMVNIIIVVKVVNIN